MLDFCGPLQTHFARTVHGPQSIAAFPVLSACNNLFTRDTADGGAVFLAKTRVREFGIASVIKDGLRGIVQIPEIMDVFCGKNSKSSADKCADFSTDLSHL